MQAGCRFTAQSHFRAVHTINTGLATGGALRGDDRVSREETQFHQAAGNILRKVQAVKRGLFAGNQFVESRRFGLSRPAPLLETQLHEFSMKVVGKKSQYSYGSF